MRDHLLVQPQMLRSSWCLRIFVFINVLVAVLHAFDEFATVAGYAITFEVKKLGADADFILFPAMSPLIAVQLICSIA